VLLHLYEDLGIGFLQHLTGHFAFVLVDLNLRRAFCVRDFFGIRPLFYTVTKNRLWVASEIKALLEVPGISRELDLEGLFHYFTLAYIPGAHTPFVGIKEIPGAHYIEVDLHTGKFDLVEYYKLRYEPIKGASEEELARALLEKMRDAVRRNLRSSAPLGLTFSGGFDTSSILTLVREVRRPEEIPTFSIVMEEPSFDESRWQRLLVDPKIHPHHEIRVGPKEVEENLEVTMAFMDEPSGDGAVIPFFLLAKEARKKVRVLLSGEGGDEVFNAYETHLANKMRRLYLRFVPRPLRRLCYFVAHSLPCDYRKLSCDFLSKRFTEGAELPVPEAHIYWRHVLTDEEKILLMPGCKDIDPTHTIFARMYEQLPFEDELDRISYLDIKFYFEGDLIVKNDRMLMAHSIEARVPFIDRLIFEFMAKVPPNLRIRRLMRRYLQKVAMKDLVPKKTYRRGNMGLEMPHSIWFLGPLRNMAERVLSRKNIERIGILDPSFVQHLFEAHLAKKRDYGRALWCIIELMTWFDLFVDSNRYKLFLTTGD
jgi:asparagine synthase (glutamine-hydrolysing)